VRPLGEVSQALLSAAAALYTPERAGTLAEIAAKAGVAAGAARTAVANLAKSEKLRIVRERKVEHRNRPVAEYAPAAVQPKAEAESVNELQRACALWVQR
jgi:hypothetical protein